MIYKAQTALLDSVLADIESQMEEAGLPSKDTISFLVAIEEIFVNVANYAYPDTEGEVEVNLVIEAGKACVTIIDSGIAFDPIAKVDPDINASVEDRPIGGLGIYIVKKSMDGIEYERKDGKNILSFWKNY